MTQSNIPQYHHSYSEDENLSIYKYLKSATNKNLVENHKVIFDYLFKSSYMPV